MSRPPTRIPIFLGPPHDERLAILAHHLGKSPDAVLSQLVTEAIDEAMAKNKLGAKIVSVEETVIPGQRPTRS